MVGSFNTNSIAPVAFRRRMPFDYETAIAPVSRLAEFPSVLLTRPSMPATTLQQFVDDASKAGGNVRNGTDWIGSFPDIDATTLGQVAGIDIVNLGRPAAPMGWWGRSSLARSTWSSSMRGHLAWPSGRGKPRRWR